MVEKSQGEWVVPNLQIPRSFGLMNVTFGILLLLFGLLSVALYVVSPVITKYFTGIVQQQAAARKAERDAEVAKLKQKEAEAKTKEEKEDLQSQREVLEKQVEPDMTAFQELTDYNLFSDWKLAAYTVGEAASGIILNILMIVSGGALLGYREWGRKLANGVAWAKIVRWISIVVLNLVLIMPITIAKTEKFQAKLQQQQAQASGGRAPVPMINMGQLSAISGAVTTIFIALIACVYPVVSLIFLNQKSARAACMSKPRSRPIEPKYAPPGELP